MIIEIDGPNLKVDGKKYVPEKTVAQKEETFAELLTRLRKESGLSLKQVGDLCHCQKSYIWQLEHGESEPGIAIAIALAITYNVPLSAFEGCRRNK